MYSETTFQAHCLFLHRHEYDWIAFWDLDEFVIIREPQNDLPALLQHSLQGKEDHAAVTFMRYNHRGDCSHNPHELSPQNSWHEKYAAREPHSETKRLNDLYYIGLPDDQGDKLVVQPLLVDGFYHHFLRSTRPGATLEPVNIPIQKAYIKYIRHYPGEHDGCDDLTFEPLS